MLDTRTLATASDVVGLCLTLLALLLWINGQMYAGFGRWTVARLAVVFSMLFSVQIAGWPQSVTILIADALGLLSLILLLEACREFKGLKPAIQWVYWAAALLIVELAWVNASSHSLQLNFVEMFLAWCVFHAWIGATLLSNLPAANRGLISTGSAFLLSSAVNLLRAVYYVTHPGATMVDSSKWNEAFLVETIVFGIVVNFSFFLMHYERLLGDREAANRALTDLKNDLEDRVEKRTAELLRAQRLESVGRLAGGVAHDFNNTLTVILGYAGLLKTDSALPPRFRDRILEIERAGLHSREIVRQLLGFSRQQPIAPRTLDLNETLKHTRTALSTLLGANIELRLETGPDLWPIRFDASQIDQIVLNLAANARDAMLNGGILTVRTANLTLKQSTLWEGSVQPVPPGKYVHFSVADNGCGMSSETLSHIFEPFFTTKPPDRGTGLGLATVYGIVRQNDGYISVQSEVGGGTTLSILFRSHQDGAVTEPSKEAEEFRPALRAASVLVVEDDPLVRGMIGEFLRSVAYTPLLAENPETALDLCADPSKNIDLLVCDVVLPRMNGTDLSNRIRALRPDLKVLMMSGHAFAAGSADPFIQKPFVVSALARKIDEIMK